MSARDDDLAGLSQIAAFGDALVAAARREDLAELPSIAAFGERLVARARMRPRRRWRTVALGLAVALPVAATSGAATAVVLRETVVRAPDPASVPDEQTPLAGTAVVSPLRAADPGGGAPWTIRVARSKTGFTCTTVGQVQDGVFGLTGLDGVFRRLPGELSDSCGQGGTMTGARVVAAERLGDVRSIVYGVAGEDLRAATLSTTRGQRALAVGPGGTFVAALRGYPEDTAAGVILKFSRHTQGHTFGGDELIRDPEAGQAWAVEHLTLGTRYRCARVRQARRGRADLPVSPTACLALRTTKRAWTADARRLAPGEKGSPGFDRWNWQTAPARTVVWGIARTPQAVKRVVLHGAGAARELVVTSDGAFAAVLPRNTDPRALRLDVTLADGTTERGRPGEGLAPDLVRSRRPR